jgi:hypothetical protein
MFNRFEIHFIIHLNRLIIIIYLNRLIIIIILNQIVFYYY